MGHNRYMDLINDIVMQSQWLGLDYAISSPNPF